MVGKAMEAAPITSVDFKKFLRDVFIINTVRTGVLYLVLNPISIRITE